MSDFEKALLFSEFLNTANFVFSNYMALIFAMLTASYFLAHKMKRWVGAIFLMLFSIGALMAGSGVLFAFTDFANLGAYIHHSTNGAASELSWLAPAGESGAMMSRMPYFVALMTFGAYVGSICFFFVVRYGRMADREEAAPG